MAKQGLMASKDVQCNKIGGTNSDYALTNSWQPIDERAKVHKIHSFTLHKQWSMKCRRMGCCVMMYLLYTRITDVTRISKPY